MAKYLNNRVRNLKVGVDGKTDTENVLEVSGNVSATKFIGDGSGLDNVVADQAGIRLEENGSLVGTATTINFSTGIEVSTVSSGFATVTVTSADIGFFSSNDTGIHTTSNIGIGTTTADGAADTNNTTVLNAGIVTANYFYGDGSALTGIGGGIKTDTNGNHYSNDLNALNFSGATDNVLIGHQAGDNITSGAENVIIGSSAGDSLEQGDGNTAVGYKAGEQIGDSSVNNVFIGKESGLHVDGNANVAIGKGAMGGSSATGGSSNVCIGPSAGNNLTGTALGANGRNNLMGSESGKNITTGDENTFIGHAAGANVGTGDSNTFIGARSGGNFTGASDTHNIAIGRSSATNVIEGSDNTIIGSHAFPGSTTLNGQISIGAGTTELIRANDTGVGIGTDIPDSAAATDNTTILNVGIVTANYFYGNVSRAQGLPASGIADISADPNPSLGGDLDLDNRAITGIGTINITGSLGGDYLSAPHGSTVSIGVTVANKTAAHRYSTEPSASTAGYILDNIEAPFLTLTPGRTYRFDQSDTTNGGHPLQFYLEADKTTKYTTNVTTSGTPGTDGYTEIQVTDETPIILHYQCNIHNYMGNAAQTNSNYIKTTYDSAFLGSVGIGTTNAASDSAADSNNTTVLNAGIVTANYFYGNGAGLSGLTGAQFSAVSQDTNPQLGGNLDAASYNITNAGIITGDNFIISGISTIGTAITFYASSGIISATKFYGDISEAEGSGISDISADTNPSLGGELDLAGNNIAGIGSINITGIATATSFSGELHTSSLLKEEVNTTNGKLSLNQDINVANGMVHYFQVAETAIARPNIRYDSSNTLNSKMIDNETISVNIITTAAQAGFTTAVNIDGSYQAVNWSGGVLPYAGGDSGNDIYSFQILKTGNSAYKVYGSVNNLTTVSNDNPRQITVANESSDTTCFPVFTTDSTGVQSPKTNADLTFNSSTGQLSAVGIAATVILTAGTAPGSATDSSGDIGEVRWDTSYLYLKTGVSEWRRIQHATW